MHLPKLVFVIISQFILMFVSVGNKTYADWNKYSSQPIISVGSENEWDNYFVGSPSVIRNKDNYKMWYAGNNRFLWRIGYAESADGINWNKSSSFVIDQIDYNNNYNIHDPRVIYKDGEYLMWFDGSNSTINNIHINFSKSPDGENWGSRVLGVFNPLYEWEMPKGISFPFVSYSDGLYKLWYGANGLYNGSELWRLGYATSSSGINWIRESKPILEGDENLDGLNANSPNVIFDSGIYRLWYHTDLGIWYAESNNGTNWVKSPTPVLTASNDSTSFDSLRVMNPFVIKSDNQYFMYYTGIGQNGKWQIGLATTEALPTPFITVDPTPTYTPAPTPTETPTPTSSPTPTPSSTPTPTPTVVKAQFSPIIIVPGMGSTWNPQAIFTCSLNTSSGWTMAPYVNVYTRLINTLTKNARLKMNNEVYIYTYDWRQTLDWQGQHLKDFIDNILKDKPAHTKVRLIGHSLGGLVIRSYLDLYHDTHKAESILTAGTPHQGTILAYPIWEAGELWTDDKLLKVGTNAIIQHCRFITNNNSVKNNNFKFLKKTKKDVVQELVPSVQDILPVFDYLKRNGNLLRYESQVYKNDWLMSHKLDPDLYHVGVFNLSGTGNRTLQYLDIKDTSNKDRKNGDWLDGYPQMKEYTREGDGTVLNMSSVVEGANNSEINGSHSDVISSTEGIQKILNYLGIPGVRPAGMISLPEETSKIVMSVSLDKSAKMEVLDPKKRVYKSDESLLVLYDPLVGVHRLKIIPSETMRTNLSVSLMDDMDINENLVDIRLRKGKLTEILLIFTNFGSPKLRMIQI
ncbi:hypothetical protein M1271_04775 [Patescibacteria group bacterium]|nr:hypothetical protein [Patescibacteria group bacterium]